jgi:outer membrane murein-binding lipoprotein Lpp
MQQFQDEIMKIKLLALDVNKKLSARIDELEAKVKELEKKVDELSEKK